MYLMKTACLMVALVTFPLGARAADGPPPTDPATIGEVHPGVLKGYLAQGALPDSKSFLPPPPQLGSPAEATDRALYQATSALRGTPRWERAARDANLSAAAVMRAYAPAIGFTPASSTTPHLAALLRRVMTDAGMATLPAKNAYARQRPFVGTGTSTCTPEEDASLAKNGSYPSGHAAMGWAWALVLAELAPARFSAILKRGIEFGESRAVCGAHWHSDVEAGRLVGAATVAALHANPVFAAQLKAAREEVAQQLAACEQVTSETRPSKVEACEVGL